MTTGLIVQDESGAQYGMTEEALADAEGFTPVSWEDGTPYKEGQSHDEAVEAAAEAAAAPAAGTPTADSTKAELLAYAEAHGVQADDSMTKAQIADAIADAEAG